MHKAADDNSMKTDNTKQSRTNKKGEKKKKSASIIPSHLMKTDISGLKGETLIFANMIFYFVNVPSSYDLEYFHKLVVENGGSFSMNLNDSVTHCIAAEKKGIKYQAATRQGRIIHYSWILDCCKEKCLLHLRPKYILFLADFARHKFPEEIDPYGDYYYWDIDISDVKQIFSNIDKVAVNSDMVNRYKKKHCGDERFCFFGGCCVYFHHAPLINADYNVISDLALKRVKQDLTMHGGQVCNSIVPATHLVVVSVLQTYNFDILYKSIPPAERRYLHDKRLHVVNNKWLEDSVEKQMKLPETDYNLKPDTLEELQIERSEENAEPLDHKHEEQEEEVVRSHAKHVPRKRSRPASSSRPARAAPRPVRRTRARKGSQLVKIDDVESEESGPGEYQCDQKPETDHISMVDGNNSEKDRKPPRAAPRPIRRARMRRGNQHAKIDDEFEESDLGERDQEDQKLDGECISKMEENISGPPPGAQVFTLGEQEPKVGESNTVEEKPQSPFQRTSAVEMMSSAPGEKMEQMIDPLQAMLLDLIPALRQTKAEDSSRVPAAKVEKVIPRGGSSTSNSGIPLPQAGTSGVPAPDPNAAPPPKKKKVSYKDVAGELLKDW
ncbi:hypothetical protein QOZ80_4BG0335660 [Eleusine coracana subsp. coracana]|nr:hypothetical protein QOZ80_4BG0335660 [Eleusine coracana subsp. coracana]